MSSMLSPTLTRSRKLTYGGYTFPLKIRPIFVLLSFVWNALLAALTLAPIPQLPVNDKILHSCGNAISSMLLYPILDPPPHPNPPWITHASLIATITISAGLVGVGSESIQGRLSYRIFDWGDVCANLSLLPFSIGASWYWWSSRQEAERGEGYEGIEEESLPSG